MIIQDTYELLRHSYQDHIAGLKVDEVRIGAYLTAVRLSDGSTGTSATIDDQLPFCAKSSRDFGDFTPLKIRGQKVSDILESGKRTSTLLSLRIAVLSAISSRIISSGKYNIIENKDPIDLIPHDPGKTITVVGAFHSYIRRLSEAGCNLSVLEMSESALPPEFRKYFVPADAFKEIVPRSEIVIITGQTLVNSTIDDLLTAVKAGTQVIVTGPSGSILPDILFRNGVSIIGAVRITKPDLLFDVVGEGGTGYHLFEYCATKICILR